MVSQECVLFARSLRENIKYGFEASDDEMFRAARLASAHEFIENLPNGYDTGQTLHCSYFLLLNVCKSMQGML